MKLLNTIIALTIPLTAIAQRDFQLVVDRNLWLNSGNAAAYTSFDEKTISRANIAYGFNSKGRDISYGTKSSAADLEAESYMKLSPNVTAYGKAAYSNRSTKEAGGSTMYGWEALQPFDIVEQPLNVDGTQANLGDKELQMFNLKGVMGWNVAGGFSVGALFDFNAGSYVKQKDLRHKNSLMDLDARLSLMQQISEKVSAGASIIYKRNTETIRYKTYGTTDQTYYVLIDYANGTGVKEMFGENGFTDGRQEQPLVNDNVGTNLQLSMKPLSSNAELLFDFTYLHRKGYYGKESQFTVSHANHTGNSYLWKARMNMPSADASRLTIVEGNLDFHDLTAYSTNYRQTKDQNNNAIVRYEYTTPTKISDRYLLTGNVFCTSYFGTWESGNNHPDIYPWRLQGGVNFARSKQTGYLGLDMNTQDVTLWAPFVDVKHNIHSLSSNVLSLELGASYQAPSSTSIFNKGITINTKASYELPCPAYPNVRPVVSIAYSYSEVAPFRHGITASVGANF